jgi:hypothetical protein
MDTIATQAGIGWQARERRERSIAAQPLDLERIQRIVADAERLSTAQLTNVIVSLDGHLQEEMGDYVTPNAVGEPLPGVNVRTARELLRRLREAAAQRR